MKHIRFISVCDCVWMSMCARLLLFCSLCFLRYRVHICIIAISGVIWLRRAIERLKSCV